MRSLTRLSLVLALAVGAASAARADEPKVDIVAKAHVQARGIPGLSIAVVRDGKVTLAKGYGNANVELDVAAKPETVFQLASVTKQFTATGVMLLVQDGKLSLDDKITERLTDLPAAWSGVTVRHLLNHTSGIQSYTSLPAFGLNPRKQYSPSELIGLVKDLPLTFQPGEKWAYNNTGYFLLGMLIEKVSGKSYDAFLGERIFTPLGMSATRLNDLGAVVPGRATGYSRQGGLLRNGEYVHPSQPYAAGALLSTVLDLARWDAALYGEQILKRSTLEQMWTATTLGDGKTQGYGFGWAVGEQSGHRVIEHGGGIQGFSTQITRYPEDRLTVIVLTNLDGGDAGGLARKIAAIYVPDLAPKPIADPDPNTTAFVRRVLTDTAAGKPNPDDYLEDVRKRIFPDGVKQVGELLKSLGELKELQLLGRSVQGDITNLVYRAVFAKGTLTARYAVTKEGKVGGVGISPE